MRNSISSVAPTRGRYPASTVNPLINAIRPDADTTPANGRGEHFDPEGAYVRRWLPELAGIPGRLIHRPREAQDGEPDYPSPIVGHAATDLWEPLPGTEASFRREPDALALRRFPAIGRAT